MAKFKYKFESIKKVKETLEKQAQKDIAVLDLEIEKQKKELANLDAELIEQKKLLQKSCKIADVNFMKNYEVVVEKKKEVLHQRIAMMILQREKKLEELIQKSKEHKIFDSLEDTHKQDFDAIENKNESLKIDEMATQKFIRQKK